MNICVYYYECERICALLLLLNIFISHITFWFSFIKS